ncbi:MAG: hypothetical protein H7Y38_02540 [Armatimonadetes bacterium]|nr:hypothetical protein [Armatimonadota bacterium]
MSTVTWETLNKQAESLSPADQLRLAEQLMRRTRAYFERSTTATEAEEYRRQLRNMAADPCVQRELKQMEADFTST